MTTTTENSISTAAHSERPGRPARSFRPLRWLNGSVHWISAVVLVYAFLINGETTGALTDPVAMRGEVKLGLFVGLIFLIRFIWVQTRRSGGGRWVGSSVRMPQSKIRRITDWGIYLGVAASVVSGLLIAYLRPGAELIPQVRGFTTSSPALNATIDAHAFISDTLEWLCGFHAVYALWYWLVKRTEWGRIAGGWVERATSNAGRVGWSYLRGQKLRL
ncbi:MAG: cytochrome b/b6 domain-containing protein [Terriglobia bacterium]